MLSSDWWLKKALKFALKRYLGRIIQTEIDADQLEVQLGQGLLELRGVLLKCDYLNEQLGESVWEIKAGYVGKLRLVIPMSKLSTDSCTLEMDEILLTVGLKASKSSQSQNVSGGLDQGNNVDESANSPISGFFDFDEGPIKPSAITSGIAKIAGGMENILQKLKLQANGLAIRFELPGNSTGHLTPLVVFKLQTFQYEGEMEAKADKNKQAGDVPHMQLHKALSFSGLTIELFEDELDEEVVNQNPPQSENQATTSHTNLPARVTWADEISSQDPGMNTQYGSSGEIQEDEISNTSGDGWHDFSSKDLGIPGSPAILIDHNLLEQGSKSDDLFEDSRHIVICDHEGIGCTGSLQLELVWQTSSQNRPTITADLILKPFQVQLHPHHLPLISSLVSIAGTNTPSPNNGTQEDFLQNSHSRSILADILMPDTTTLAQDLVYESWYHDKASATSGSEYFDAESLLGSLRSGLSSFASASASGLAQGANYVSSSITGFEMGNSATPLPVPDTGKLHLKFSTQDLSLVLWYPQTSKQMLNEDWSVTDDYRPRLSLEAGDILLTHESLGQESNTNIQVFRIEAVDHIPVLSSESNLSPSSLNDMIKLPEALPPTSSGVRQVPSFSGVCISPMRKSMYASMLSHVSSLSASMGLNSTSGPQVQISPVLCIAGSVKAARGSPSLTISLITRKDSERKSVLKEEISTVLDFKLRATSVWVNVPMLTRLFEFLEPLIIHLGGPTSSQGFSNNIIQSETRNPQTNKQRPAMKTSRPTHNTQTNLEVKGSLSNVSIFVISDGKKEPRTHLALDFGAAQSKRTNSEASLQVSQDSQSIWSIKCGLNYAKIYLLRSEHSSDCDDETSSLITSSCLLNISGPDNNSIGAIPLSVQFTLNLRPSTPHALCNEAFKYVQTRIDGSSKAIESSEELDLKDSMLKSASVICHIQAPYIGLGLCKADLIALRLLNSSFSEWQNSTSAHIANLFGDVFPYTECSTTAILLDCGKEVIKSRGNIGNPKELGFHCQIEPQVSLLGSGPENSLFDFSSQNFSWFSVLGLDTRAASNYTILRASANSLHGYSLPKSLLSSGENSGITFMQVQRQMSLESLEAQGLNFVNFNGVTVSTIENDLTLSWTRDLAHTFTTSSGNEQDQTREDLKEDAAQNQSQSLLNTAQNSVLSSTSNFRDDRQLFNEDEQGSFGGLEAEFDLDNGEGPLGLSLEEDIDNPNLSLNRERYPHIGNFSAEEQLGLGSETRKDSKSGANNSKNSREGAGPSDSCPTELEEKDQSSQWCVHFQNCALRDNGPINLEGEGPSLDAALLVGDLQWKTNTEPNTTEIRMSNLTLFGKESHTALVNEISPSSEEALPRNAGGETTSQESGNIQPDLCTSRLLDFGYTCLAQERELDLAIFSPSAEENGSTSTATNFSKTVLKNQRLHCPLTTTSYHRLKTLLGRLSSNRCSGSDPIHTEDIEVPQETEESSHSEQKPKPHPEVPVAVLAEVDEKAFEARGDTGNECLDLQTGERYFIPVVGGLTEEAVDDSEIPGGAPIIIEDFFHKHYKKSTEKGHSVDGKEKEESGFWYGERGGENSEPPIFLDDYVEQPPPDYKPPSEQKSALDPLPENYPLPLSRFVLENFNIVIALCQEEQENESHSATSTRIELELEGFCLQSDTFDSNSEHVKRLAVSVSKAELRDCWQAPETSKGWHKILSQYVSSTTPQLPDTCLLSMELDSIRPDGGNEELRLKVSALPLRLRIDQDILAFLQSFFSSKGNSDSLFDSFEKIEADWEEEEPPAINEALVFIQRCEIKPIVIVVDYKPRRLNVGSLGAGNLAEVVNMTVWSDVRIVLPFVRITGAQGWHIVGSSIIQNYIQDVISSQVHSFVAGIKPLQSIMRVGAAAGQLLAIPAEALRGRPQSASKASQVPITRQIQRGIIGLMRAILGEMLGISAGALGGLHLVLAGPSAAQRPSYQVQPSTVTEGMRAASQRLSAGMGEIGSSLKAPFSSRPSSSSSGNKPRSRASKLAKAIRAAPGALAKPISEGAAAARLTILGAKNSLDPARYEKRKQER